MSNSYNRGKRKLFKRLTILQGKLLIIRQPLEKHLEIEKRKRIIYRIQLNLLKAHFTGYFLKA